MEEKLTAPCPQAADTMLKLRLPHKHCHIREFYKPYVRFNAKLITNLSFWAKITTKIIKTMKLFRFHCGS